MMDFGESFDTDYTVLKSEPEMIQSYFFQDVVHFYRS